MSFVNFCRMTVNILFLKARRKDQGNSEQLLGAGGQVVVWMVHLGTICLFLPRGNCLPKGHSQKQQQTHNSGFICTAIPMATVPINLHRETGPKISLRNSSIDPILEIFLLSSLILIDSNIKKI